MGRSNRMSDKNFYRLTIAVIMGAFAATALVGCGTPSGTAHNPVTVMSQMHGIVNVADCETDAECIAAHGEGGYGTEGEHVAWVIDTEGNVHSNCFDYGPTVCEGGTVFDDNDENGPRVEHRSPNS